VPFHFFYRIPAQPFTFECTYNLTGYGLDIVAAAYKIKLDHHHALADAEACARIFINIQNGIFPEISAVDISMFKKKTIWDSFNKKSINRSDLQPDFENADTNSPFYMKKVVFTGDMKCMDRSEAAHSAMELGADVNTSISKNTHFVIVGERPGPSKMKKIEELRSKGFPINILNEGQFQSIIKEFSSTPIK
jgi:DNA polymerase III subunit epsilon